MGRKIPGKKHKGVRDPEKQREIRLQKLMGKINAPPLNPDDQEIPQSLNRLIELKELAKLKHKKLKKTNKFPIQREKKESKTDYFNRINTYCDEIIEENALQNKHNIEVKRNPYSGEIVDVLKREDDKLEEIIKKKKTEIKLKQRNKFYEEPKETLTKSQKRQRKLALKKQKKNLDHQLDHQVVRDNVKFGEVVHAPPTLSIPRRALKEEGVARPGKKNLLLKSILKNDTKNMKLNDVPFKKSQKTIDTKGKRKHLPNALRRKIEGQQMEIIEAYRAIKQQKMSKKV
ncbi:hypothetical protein FQA39_LY17071 [Lamprigera yunnana]|nr:hypothetical protein FQA39_LY17071 [Lamprigera yunnana]